MSSEQLVITRCREGLWLVWVLSPLLSMISIGLVFVYPPLESVAVWGAGQGRGTSLIRICPYNRVEADSGTYHYTRSNVTTMSTTHFVTIVYSQRYAWCMEFFFSVKGESNV